MDGGERRCDLFPASGMNTLFDRIGRLFEEGHRRPLTGLLSDSRFDTAEQPRAAAVLIAVTERERPGALLIHRPLTMRRHGGQVGFPGGVIDPGEDAITAALREADEELGITPAAVRVIGPSDPYRTGTGYDVTPVLGIIPADLPLRPNPAEVDSWFEAPLDVLLDPANHQSRSAMWQGARRDYLSIEWREHQIWGVTAAIIANLSRRIAWVQDRVDG